MKTCHCGKTIEVCADDVIIHLRELLGRTRGMMEDRITELDRQIVLTDQSGGNSSMFHYARNLLEIILIRSMDPNESKT